MLADDIRALAEEIHTIARQNLAMAQWANEMVEKVEPFVPPHFRVFLPMLAGPLQQWALSTVALNHDRHRRLIALCNHALYVMSQPKVDDIPEFVTLDS